MNKLQDFKQTFFFINGIFFIRYRCENNFIIAFGIWNWKLICKTSYVIQLLGSYYIIYSMNVKQVYIFTNVRLIF